MRALLAPLLLMQARFPMQAHPTQGMTGGIGAQDAGAPGSMLVRDDTGVTTDGGELDAGEVPRKRVLSVACTCTSIDVAPLLILLGWSRRRLR